MIAGRKKLSFFRALKNIISCVFCSIKDCPVRYNSKKQNITITDEGCLLESKCIKEKVI